MFSANVKERTIAQDIAKVFLKYAICVTLAESGEWAMLGRVVEKTDF